MVQWKITLNGRKLILEGPLFHWTMIMGGRVPSLKLTAKAPKYGWLEYDPFLLGFGLFSGAFAVSFREASCFNLSNGIWLFFPANPGGFFPGRWTRLWNAWRLHCFNVCERSCPSDFNIWVFPKIGNYKSSPDSSSQNFNRLLWLTQTRCYWAILGQETKG